MVFKTGELGFDFNGNSITKVLAHSQADNAGVRKGWTILKINGDVQPNETIAISKAFSKLKDNKKTITILFKERSSFNRSRYCVISHYWARGFDVEELQEGEDPNTFWERYSSEYCSIMFRSDNRGKKWYVYKKQGFGSIYKILQEKKSI